jgi:hypothetical protein
MGRRVRGFLISAPAAVLCWIALAGSAQASPDLTGDWIITEGPRAGTTIHVTYHGNAPAQNFVSKHDNKATEARGFIRDPNDHCPYYHFEGHIEGKAIKETDCVQVTSTGYAQQFLIEISQAIKKEEKDKPNAAVKDLNQALAEAEKALQAGKINQQTFDEIEFGIKHAHKLDETAENELKVSHDEKAEKALNKAINLKHEVAGIAPPALKVLQPPQLKPLAAVFQAGASQTVYTENATDPDGRRLRYTWALVELNDPTCINFEPNTPAQNQAIWHHGDTQGCNHALEGSNGHQGVVGVVVSDEKFSCGAAYSGSNTGNGGPPSACQPLSVK